MSHVLISTVEISVFSPVQWHWMTFVFKEPKNTFVKLNSTESFRNHNLATRDNAPTLWAVSCRSYFLSLHRSVHLYMDVMLEANSYYSSARKILLPADLSQTRDSYVSRCTFLPHVAIHCSSANKVISTWKCSQQSVEYPE